MQNPVIMAVEPDPSQAGQLSALFRRQFQAELVLSGSTAGAVAKLHGRVPELVLTSALIPPRDETELIAWLRGLGAKGSHVQTVTIPTLANGAPQEVSRVGGGLFGRENIVDVILGEQGSVACQVAGVTFEITLIVELFGIYEDRDDDDV